MKTSIGPTAIRTTDPLILCRAFWPTVLWCLHYKKLIVGTQNILIKFWLYRLNKDNEKVNRSYFDSNHWSFDTKPYALTDCAIVSPFLVVRCSYYKDFCSIVVCIDLIRIIKISINPTVIRTIDPLLPSRTLQPAVLSWLHFYSSLFVLERIFSQLLFAKIYIGKF